MEKVEELKEKYCKLEENQQEILQTLNNGLKSQTKDNGRRLSKMEDNFNKLLFAIGGGMFAMIVLLIQILMKLAQLS